MNGTIAETGALIEALIAQSAEMTNSRNPQVVVFPPFTALAAAAVKIEGTSLQLGAQDMFWKERGAFTGQTSPLMLSEIGCEFVIVGHSETRGRFGVPEPDFDQVILAYFGESDAAINRKVRAAIAHGITPIVCVGETLAEREANDTDIVVSGQLMICLKGLSSEQMAGVIIAYEPVWAIGTGEVCDAEEADRVCGVLREAVDHLFDASAASAVRILYGGSVKPDNASVLLHQPNIDGALVGGASLKAADFVAIVAATA
jgi:triosephosphate isomerase